MTASTLELLRTPLHFAVFARLPRADQHGDYSTLAGLFAQYTRDVRARVSHDVGHLDWPGVIHPLVDYMSEHQELAAPDHLIDPVDRREVAALTSEGLLVPAGRRLGFLHEAYFDYLFARRFVAAKRDLVAFLTESGQELFRRAQTRQVLEYLAEVDRGGFRDVVGRLLRDPRIRTHLKDVTAIVLEHLDATAEDWRLVEPFAFDGAPPHRLEYLLARPRWFDAIDALDRWPGLLDDPPTAEIAGHQLIVAAAHRPARVVELVRPHVATSERWTGRLRSLITQSFHPAVTALTVELLETGQLDAAAGESIEPWRLWTAISRCARADPAGAARLVGAHLRRATARALADGVDDPFTHGYVGDIAEALHAVPDIAAWAPREYVDEVMPTMLAIAERGAVDWAPDALRRCRVGASRGPRTSVASACASGLEAALQELAKADATPAVLGEFAALAEADFDLPRFLVCRIHTSTVATHPTAAAADRALRWLSSDTRNFDLGWVDGPRWAARELLEVATGYCSDHQLNAVTACLLAYYPSWETRPMPDVAPLAGRSQYDLLSAVAPGRRSAAVLHQLIKLGEAFPNDPPTDPSYASVFAGRPPIPVDQVEHLSDEAWLDAIDQFRSDNTSWGDGRFRGGRRQLAGQLAQRAVVEPDRFARLALTFGSETPAEHIERVVDAVAEQIPVDLLGQLCRHARTVAGSRVGPTLCRVIGAHEGDTPAALFEVLEDCARDSDPPADPVPRAAEPGPEAPPSTDLINTGLYTTRGAAAAAIARLLFARTAHATRLVGSIEVLVTDPAIAVRACVADAIAALTLSDLDDALVLARRLLDNAPVELLATPTANRLLQLGLWHASSTFGSYLQRALRGTGVAAQAAGESFAFAFAHGLPAAEDGPEIHALSAPARQGAAAALATEPSLAFETLLDLLDDESADVRTAACSASRNVADLDAEQAQRFTQALTNSASAEEHLRDLLFALERSARALPAATLDACEAAVVSAGPKLGDLSSRHASTSTTIVSLVLRLYRDAQQDTRLRCLDLIDRLCELRAYGLEEALEDQR